MPVKKEQFIPAIWFELKLTPKDQPVGFFTEVSGLGKEIEFLTHSEGGRNDYQWKLPTRMKHPNLVLKRGVTALKDLEEWTAGSEGPELKEITLTMYNQALEKIRSWSFSDAYPVKWTGPAFNAAQSTVATEVIEIAHTGAKPGN